MARLDGILVVSVEQAVAAPLCSCRLADAGARVIKIERAEGDFARGYDAAVHGESAYFVWLNRGKESVVLDLKADGDKALLRRLIARADVFIQNLVPGAAARAGLRPVGAALAPSATYHLLDQRLWRLRPLFRPQGLRPPHPGRERPRLRDRLA